MVFKQVVRTYAVGAAGVRITYPTTNSLRFLLRTISTNVTLFNRQDFNMNY